jgi:hypothetical protein
VKEALSDRRLFNPIVAGVRAATGQRTQERAEGDATMKPDVLRR